MATDHKLSDIILGQAGGSEFGIIGNVAEFNAFFLKNYGYRFATPPVAYIKVSYLGGQSQHKLDFGVPGYAVLANDRIVFFAKAPWLFVIEIPLTAINRNLMFVEAKGFARLALTARDRDKFLKVLENVDVSKESKKILANLPEEVSAMMRQKYNKTDINEFVDSAVNIAAVIKKRTLQIPYASYWGLEKPKFFLGLSTEGLDEFVFAWAKAMLKT
ncbi:MAG: hypothetical protein NTY99_00460 [DPANN group archaeon]|nr:hypothetical protein [DPANN group archaeon]